MWEIAVALARAILEDQEKREQAAADEQLAQGIINAVRQAIEESTARILDFLRQQHLDELAGRINGLFVTFTRYAADPVANHERLVRLIDDLAQIIGEMELTLAKIGTEERPAMDMFPAYASAVALSAIAITERRHRFNVNEPMSGILDRAKGNSLRVKEVLRRRSDMRFRFAAVTNEPGTTELGYTFNGVFELVALIPTGGNPRAALELVNHEMSAHREREFPNYPGVSELSQLIARLEDSIGLQLVVTAVPNRIPLFDVVETEPSTEGPTIFRLASSAAPVPVS